MLESLLKRMVLQWLAAGRSSGLSHTAYNGKAQGHQASHSPLGDPLTSSTSTGDGYPAWSTNSLRTGKSPCYSWVNPLFLWQFSIANY